jgi:hypothetical protein
MMGGDGLRLRGGGSRGVFTNLPPGPLPQREGELRRYVSILVVGWKEVEGASHYGAASHHSLPRFEGDGKMARLPSLGSYAPQGLILNRYFFIYSTIECLHSTTDGIILTAKEPRNKRLCLIYSLVKNGGEAHVLIK